MLPWIHLDTGDVRGKPGALRPMRRGDEFSIVVGTIELTNTRLSGSEKALAEIVCPRLADRPRSGRPDQFGSGHNLVDLTVEEIVG